MIPTMKAAVLHDIGDLRVEEVPVPVCGEDEVLVRVRRCGICGSDIPRIFTKGTYHFPTIPGHEFAGEVVASPTGEHVGERVCVFPLLPCGQCAPCRQEEYALCEHYDYYGSRRDGGLAEYIAVKTFNLVPLPDTVSFDEAALCEPCAVALHALRRAGVGQGDRVVILGAGPIGLLAAQAATMYGAASVALVDIDPQKLAFARSLGFEIYQEDQPPADVVIEGTGAAAALANGLAIVRRGGTVLCMGNPAGGMALGQNDYWHILRKELTLKGTWNSHYAHDQNDWRDAIDALAAGRIRAAALITQHVPLGDCVTMLERMRDRAEFYVKVMVDLD